MVRDDLVEDVTEISRNEKLAVLGPKYFKVYSEVIRL